MGHRFPQDELDAAEKVVRSRAEIRQVLIDHDNRTAGIFGNGKVKTNQSDVYKELGPDGSPIVMQQEMEREMQGQSESAGSKGKTSKKDSKKDSTLGSKKKKSASKK
jgi:hypothetical protein